MKHKALLFLALVALLSLSAAGVSAQTTTNDNIVDIVAKSNNLDTLHSAIVDAGLADTLASAGSNYTLFAPVDAAFTRLGEDDPALWAAAAADPDGALATVLLFHVVPGRLTANDIVEMGTLTTLQGEELTVTTNDDGDVFVNGARVRTADIPAKNGVIHLINTVLLPDAVTSTATTEATTPSATTTGTATTGTSTATTSTTGAGDLMTIAQMAAATDDFSALLAALEATGLTETLAGPGQFTVFVPTESALAELAASGLTDAQLEAILRYHVVSDHLTRDQLATDDLVPTLSDGRPLFIRRDGAQIINISGAQVLRYDIPAANGIIHLIDRVMIP